MHEYRRMREFAYCTCGQWHIEADPKQNTEQVSERMRREFIYGHLESTPIQAPPTEPPHMGCPTCGSYDTTPAKFGTHDAQCLQCGTPYTPI